jgi:hypothetical protein
MQRQFHLRRILHRPRRMHEHVQRIEILRKRKRCANTSPHRLAVLLQESISSPASALAVISKVTWHKQYRSQARKSCRKRPNVSNVVQRKRRLCKQTRVVPSVSRQLWPRPFKVDEYKKFDTNDPNHLINTDPWYPGTTPVDMIRINGLNGNNWSAMDEERHNLSWSLELLAGICLFG